MAIDINERQGLTRRDFLRLGAAVACMNISGMLVGCDNTDEFTIDTVIRNGTIMDPLSGISRKSDVYILGKKILSIPGISGPPIDQSLKIKREIDASGLVVTPGFIDIHAHEGVLEKTMECFVLDGVTTMIGGNCGGSEYPIAELFDKLETSACLINYASYVGANTLRGLAGVSDNAAANNNQIALMQDLARQEMNSGALGVSYGIQYQPAASWEEILALGRTAAEFSRLTAAHGRDGGVGPGAIDALEEMIRLAVETGIPHQYSHIGSMLAFGDLMDAALARLAEAQAQGLPVTADIYGYDAGMSSINAPNLDLGVFERYNCTAGDLEVLEDLIIDGALYLSAGSRFTSREEYAWVMQAFYDNRVEGVPIIIAHTQKWDKIFEAFKSPYVCICSDGAVYQLNNQGGYTGHPRVAGSRSVWLGRYIRDQKIADLMTGLFKASAMPAMILGLDSKGRMTVGADADITIFRPETILDQATYGDGFMTPPLGIEYVLVNGQVTVSGGRLASGIMAGRPLRCDWRVSGYRPR